MPPAVICKRLDALILNISGRSKRTWVWRGRKETDKKVYPVWNRIKTREGGIIYEINAEHPIFRRLVEKFPAGEKDFKNLLKLIAAELPLNSLVVDLNSDENKIENANFYTADSVREILKIFTDGLSDAKANELLETLKQDEPYKSFSQVVDEFRKDESL